MEPNAQLSLAAWTIAVNMPQPVDGQTALPTAEVIPAPNAEGIIEGRDGRRYRIRDAAALAGRINAQAVAARIDFDHRSERVSPNFAGSTAAEGWLKNVRVNGRGGIDADLDLSGWAAGSLRSQMYRYLSPALFHTSDMEITGISSVALVNDPNFRLEAPTIHSRSEPMTDRPEGVDEATWQKAQDALAEREKAADARALNAATRAVDQAIADGKVPEAAKDAHLETIKCHKDGIDAGLNAFEKTLEASAEGDGDGKGGGLSDDALKTLGTRVAPSAATKPAGNAEQPAFPTPSGVQPPDPQRLSTHHKIAEYAQKNGITYREAVTHFGAMGF